MKVVVRAVFVHDCEEEVRVSTHEPSSSGVGGSERGANCGALGVSDSIQVGSAG